jgi:hypothetical protein
MVQVGAAQIGAAQVGGPQVGIAQIGLAQVSEAQVGAGQVGVANVGAVQMVDRNRGGRSWPTKSTSKYLGKGSRCGMRGVRPIPRYRPDLRDANRILNGANLREADLT